MTLSKNGSDIIKHSLAFTGCFGSYNVFSCVRDTTLTILGFITFIVCLAKLYRLHSNRHSLPNQYIIFYSGLVECILCGINWMYLAVTAIQFVTQFLKIVCQCLVVCRFHCLLAARMVRSDEERVKRYVSIGSIITFVYILIITIVGLATMKDEFSECAEPEWLLASVAEFLIVQLFLVAGICITRQLSAVSMAEDNRNEKKRDLWVIIFVFEISAVMSLVHDIVMKITGPKNSCQGVFLDTSAGYTAVYITVNITRWLLPLWAMAAVYDTENNEWANPADTFVPVFNNMEGSGTFTSQFRPRGRSLHYKHSWFQNDDSVKPLIPPTAGQSQTSTGSSYGSLGGRAESAGTSTRIQAGDRYPPIA